MSMLIRNYGLFWRRADVFWGKPKVKGNLKGVLAGAVTANPIDFRDQLAYMFFMTTIFGSYTLAKLVLVTSIYLELIRK